MQAIIQLNWTPSNDPGVASQTIYLNGSQVAQVTQSESSTQITVECDQTHQASVQANGGAGYPPVYVDVFVQSSVVYQGPSNLSWTLVQLV